MWALAQSGVHFRTIVREDSTIERWQQPELSAWEVPKRNPHERRPRAPRGSWKLGWRQRPEVGTSSIGASPAFYPLQREAPGKT